METEKKKVVIIGGGFAGSTVAKSLEKDKRFSVTLIDTKEYFEFTPGVLRTLVEPRHVKKLEVKHSHYLQKAKIVIGKVISISENEVMLLSGRKRERIGFDYLVIASGSSYNKPIKEQNEVIASSRANHLRESNEKLCNAEKIVVVGGGLVGVELAAEIATHYDVRDGKKQLYLIHSRSEIMERNSEKSREYAKSFLIKKGVNLILGERLKDYRNKKIILESGKKMAVDIVFLAVGIKPNSDFMEKNFSDKLDIKGFIRVNRNLQLSGIENIFVTGDVSSIREEKLAQNAEKQAEIVVKNIKCLESGEELKEYKGEKKAMVISLGKWDGILEFAKGKKVLTGIIPGILKTLIEKREMMLKKKVI